MPDENNIEDEDNPQPDVAILDDEENEHEDEENEKVYKIAKINIPSECRLPLLIEYQPSETKS